MKKIMIFTILGILLIGIVIAVSIDKEKIEKIKLDDGTYEYYIYRLSQVTSDKEIAKNIIKLNEEEINLQESLDKLIEDKEGIINACKEQYPLDNLQETEEEYIYNLNMQGLCELDIDLKISDLNNSINFIPEQINNLEKIQK